MNLVTSVVQWSSAMARIESCAIVAVVQSYLVSMRTTYYLSKPVTQCLLATSCESFYRVLLGGSRNRMRNLPDLMVMPVMPVMMMMVMPVIMMPLTFTFWGLTPQYLLLNFRRKQTQYRPGSVGIIQGIWQLFSCCPTFQKRRYHRSMDKHGIIDQFLLVDQ